MKPHIAGLFTLAALAAAPLLALAQDHEALWAAERARQAELMAAENAGWEGDFDVLNQPLAGAEPADVEVNVDRMMQDVRALAALERWSPSGREAARRYITEQLGAIGWAAQRQDYAHPKEGFVVEGANLIATLPGDDPSLPMVVVEAHFDAAQGSPGAADNASGVAGVLELARTLAEAEVRGQRTIQFVFMDQEEIWLEGAMAYLHALGGAKPKAVVVVESMGLSCATPGCQAAPPSLTRPPPNTGTFLSLLVDIEHKGLVDAFRITAAPDLPLYILPVKEQGWGMVTTRRSDNAAFWDAGIGTILFTDTGALRNAHYHKPTDTADKLDPSFFAKAERALIGGVWVLANE